jgi:hypothetical protein
MITIKKTALPLFIAASLGASSITAFAAEASLNETISDIQPVFHV